MAPRVFTEEEFSVMRQMFRSDPTSLKAYRESGLTTQDLESAIQSLENWFDASRGDQKAALDAGAGQTISNFLAKQSGGVYYQFIWRDEKSVL